MSRETPKIRILGRHPPHPGGLLAATHRSDEAEKAYRRAIEVHAKRSAELPGQAVDENPVASCYLELAALLSAAGRAEDAKQLYQRLLEMRPKDAAALRNLSWLLSTCPDLKLRDPSRAVNLAKQTVELRPKEGNNWNTLGVANYRSGDWKEARAALEKSMELRKGGDAFDWIFQAMTQWRLDQKKEARNWYEKADAWMEKNAAQNEELIRFRAEARDLFGIGKKKD